MDTLQSFIPIDRLDALARHQGLPEAAHGAVLFADVPGFTPLTEAMARVFGPQRGAEELANQLNRVYTALIDPVHRYHGAVISFSGDSINCWFDGDDGRQAAAAGLAMQAAVARLEPFQAKGGLTFQPSIKVAIAVGPVRRFLAGDPAIQHLDVLTGSTLEVLDKLGHLVERGKVVMEASAAAHLLDSGVGLSLDGEREDQESGARAVILSGLESPLPPNPWPEPGAGDPPQDSGHSQNAAHSEDAGQPQNAAHSEDAGHPTDAWLLPAVRERLRTGTGRFLAELRPAAVLFLNFGGLDYNADGAGLLLDTYLRKVQACLVRYEGAPLQLNTGDKGSYLYAAFGAPLAHDDDAARAVTAAQELLEISSGMGFITCARVGIAQGMIFAGAYGSPSRQTYGLIGDKVNVAARLMQHANPGEALCDKEVAAQTRRYWDFEPLPPVQLKGKDAPTPVYRPVRRRPTRVETAAELAAQAGQLAPLVGRQAELERLSALLDDLQAGKGGALFVEGEAGIGKSRLVGALLEMAKERGLAVLPGGGQSIEQNVPYRAWRDVFQAYFDLGDSDNLAVRQEKVRRAAKAGVPRMLQRLPLLNEVLSLGLPDNPLTSTLDPRLRRESLSNLLAALLRARLQSGPLVVILEDAHWMDVLSWELAQTIQRVALLEKKPLLLALVTRPLEETHPGGNAYHALRGLPAATVIALETLDETALTALIASQLGIDPHQLPAQVFQFVQARSDGNPFFAEELVQTMRDRGLLVIEQGENGPVCRAHPALAQEGQALPDTLQGLILSRIDRLSTEQQLALKVAAVIGRTFAYSPLRDTLTQFVPLADSALKEDLSELVRRELTLLEATEPELTYLFKHIITQEAAYQSLLYAQRTEIHLAVARWYETLLQADETLAASMFPLLAYHYRQAEQAERERYYARKAGEAAAGAFANDSALTYFTRALELTPPEDLEAIYELLRFRQGIYELQGNQPANQGEINRLAEVANQLAGQAAGKPLAAAAVVEKQVKILLSRSRMYNDLGQYEPAEESARQAKALAYQLEDIGLRLHCHIELSFVMTRRARFPEAFQELEPALELARASELRNQEARILHQLGAAADLSGNRVMAQGFFQQCLEVSRLAGNRHAEGLALNNLGVSAWHQGNLTAAREYLEQSLSIIREIGARSSEVYPIGNIGLIFYQQRKYAEASDYWQQAVALARELNQPYVEAMILGNLGNAYQAAGDFTQALSYYEQGLAIAQASGDRQTEALELEDIACVQMLMGELDTTGRYLEKALQRSQEVGDRDTEASVERDQAIRQLWLGRPEQALIHCERALAIVQQLDGVDDKETYCMVQGEINLQRNQLDEAMAAYQEAEKIYSEKGKPAVEAAAGLIRVDLAREDIAQAAARAAEILAFLENDSVADAANPAGIYLACCQALQAAGDSRSAEVLAEGYRFLQSRAGQLAPDQREMYFENVPANKELRNLWVSKLNGKSE